MNALTDYDLAGFRQRLERWGCKSVHAERILREFYAGSGRLDLSNSQLPAALRSKLRTELPLRQSHILFRRQSADGTLKLLVGFDVGGAAEAVLMPAVRPDRAAGCISSQIGCAMGCDFCASTRGGLERNLSSGEIVEQFLQLREAAASVGRRLATIVFMGMGEPLHNLDQVIPAIRRIADPAMGALGWRHVTVSTVGIVPGIDRLADANLNVHLALSLHAADDETRSRIVPVNRRYPISRIIDATRRFQLRTGRIPTLEYCLLAGVNDSDEHAIRLAQLVDGFRAHVNLIPYNSIGAGVSGAVYERPSPQRVEKFLSLLRQRGVVAHRRHTRGDDVDAACGQLRQMLISEPDVKVPLQVLAAHP